MADKIHRNLSRLEELEQRRQDLEKTLQLVLEFPAKVSYDRLIPISKVAFCPGKIVHTNEFKVLEMGGNEKDLSALSFVSYKDAAQVLQERLHLVDSMISSETGVPIASKDLSSSSYYANDAAVSKDKKLSTKPFSEPKPSAASKASSTENITAPTQHISNGQSQNSLKDRIFEIREYFDGENASSPGHELMDITEQIENLEKLSQSESFQHGPGESNPYLLREDSEFIQELARIAAEQSQEEFSEESSFMYDEDALPHQRGRKKGEMPPVDDIFERIEQQQRRQIEAQLQRQKKAASNGKQGGWKSGFLGGGGEKKNATSTTASISATAPPPTPPSVTDPLTPPVELEDPKGPKKKGVSFSSTNQVQEIDNRETMAQKIRDMAIEERKATMAAAAAARERPAEGVTKQPVKKPFSGTIMEKFP